MNHSLHSAVSSEVRNRQTPQQRALPAMAAAGLILSGVVAGHALLGVACGLAAGLGVYLRARDSTRLAGSLLMIASAGVFFIIGLGVLSKSTPDRQAEARAPQAEARTGHPGQ